MEQLFSKAGAYCGPAISSDLFREGEESMLFYVYSNVGAALKPLLQRLITVRCAAVSHTLMEKDSFSVIRFLKGLFFFLLHTTPRHRWEEAGW